MARVSTIPRDPQLRDPQLEVRHLGVEEWTLWRGLRLRSLAEEPDAFGSSLAHEQGYTEADWREDLAEGCTVVAFTGGEPIGCGAVFKDRPGSATVVAMWVAPTHRRRGLSHRILDVLAAWARSQGLSLELGVNRTNATALAAYESYGFVTTGRCHPLRDGSEQVCDIFTLPG